MVVAAGLTDVNFALSFWTALTFLILIVVLGKFAWGPILQMLETRERTIADAIESAKKERAAAEAASAEMRAALERASGIGGADPQEPAGGRRREGGPDGAGEEGERRSAAVGAQAHRRGEAAGPRGAALANRRPRHRSRKPAGADEPGRNEAEAAGRGVSLPAPEGNQGLGAYLSCSER